MAYSVLKSLLFKLDPEIAHNLVKVTSSFTPTSLVSAFTEVRSRTLRTTLGEAPLKNPIGLAGGFDKNADLIPFLRSLGFGFLELGSVTALSCTGRDKPRIFRLPKDQSLINRMGLPNHGAENFAKKMAAMDAKIPYGVNIAKTPDFAQEKGKILSGIDDFLTTFRRVYFLGCYTVLNLSCPNSEDGRSFEDPKLAGELLAEIQAAKKEVGSKKPLLIKLSPDSDDKTFTRLIDVALKNDVDGFVLTNTTTSRADLVTAGNQIKKIGMGGLSGKALFAASNQKLKTAFEIVDTKKILIGVGGIMSFEDVLEKFACGASLVQIYTGFIYNGPLFVRELNKKLVAHCKKMGLNSYRELVGRR